MKTCIVCNKSKPKDSFYEKQRRCKECLLPYLRNLRKENPEKYRNACTKSRLKLQFGMTQEDYDKLLIKQGGVCAICKGPQNIKNRYNLCVDHCHETKAVRGLLCNDCNIGLGMFKDNKNNLLSAVKYLS